MIDIKILRNEPEKLIEALFKTDVPLSAPEQKEIFTDALTQTLSA